MLQLLAYGQSAYQSVCSHFKKTQLLACIPALNTFKGLSLGPEYRKRQNTALVTCGQGAFTKCASITVQLQRHRCTAVYIYTHMQSVYGPFYRFGANRQPKNIFKKHLSVQSLDIY